jgi:hypothetical protein
MISTVLVPTTPKELADLSRLFFSWHACQRINVTCRNQLQLCSKPQPRLLITFASPQDDKLAIRIRNLFEIYSLEEIFSGIDIFFLALEPADDIYIKDIPFRSKIPLLKRLNPPPQFGLKSGPNLQFFKSISLCDPSGITLLNETDMLPIVPNWIEICNQAVPSGVDFLVAGAAYLGNQKLSARIALHLNGNALYNTSSKYFAEEYLPMWRHSLASMCASEISAAYDVWLDLAISHSSENRDREHLSQKSLWLKNQPPLSDLIKLKSKMLIISQIYNFCGAADCFAPDQIARLAEGPNPPALIHSRASIPSILSYLLLRSREIMPRSSLNALSASIDGVKGFEAILAIL